MSQSLTLCPAAFDLIVRFETGGQRYYENVYKSAPHWPGGQSGVTIGCGYDLAYETRFASDWAGKLAPIALTRLARCRNLRGSKARQALSGVRDIVIPWPLALEVFREHTVTQEILSTLRAFPGALEKLPAEAFGALVSLIYNRGELIDQSPRRQEMWDIRQLIHQIPTVATASHLRLLASLVRKMKRLWPDNPQSDGDLVDRREAEARLIESALP